MTTREGFSWTPKDGVKVGLPCIGAIYPPEHNPAVNDVIVFDIIVIGAGYAGLIAARDLSTQGKKVLLLEARDRIGGRTWHTNIAGFNYEMGGAWIHWNMPHIYREISLYGLQDDWIMSQVEGGKDNYCSVHVNGKSRDMPHTEEVRKAPEMEIFKRTWGLFCDIDGAGLRHTWPYPLGLQPDNLRKWDRLSCQDRLDQISDSLELEEIGIITAVLLQMGGGPLDRMGFLDAMRWYALGGFTPTGLNDIALTTRLGSGQSALARRIFENSVTSGLAYSFNTAVASIAQKDGLVTVVSRSNKCFNATRVICTVPLNVLSDISFFPDLEPTKVLAIKQGHSNRGNKIHADVEGANLLSWTAFAHPGKGMVCALADNLTPSKDTHLVLFGPTSDAKNGIHLAAEGIEQVRLSIAHLLPSPQKENIKRIVYHDWCADEFSKGAWCFYPPKFATTYLEALRQSHGSVHFASADWSHGWRGWIDGAIEQGATVATQVGKAMEEAGHTMVNRNEGN